MLKKVLLIVNPVAGRGEAETYGKELAKLLMEVYNSHTEMKLTRKEGDATQWGKTASEDGFDTVICLGGDGTVSETVAGIVQADKKPLFAFIPMGTVNDLGRVLGYSMNPEEAIQDFRHLTTGHLDIGQINDEIFINVLAVGPIAEEVMKTSSDDKNKFGVLAYIKDGVKGFFNKNGYQMKLTLSDGSEHEFASNLVLMGLTNSVGGVKVIFPDAEYDDGLIHFVAVKGDTPFDTLRASLTIGFSEINPENLLRFSDTSLKLESKGEDNILTNVDGDEGPALPIEVEVLKHEINILLKKTNVKNL